MRLAEHMYSVTKDQPNCFKPCETMHEYRYMSTNIWLCEFKLFWYWTHFALDVFEYQLHNWIYVITPNNYYLLNSNRY